MNLRIAITGSTGLIGEAVVAHFLKQGALVTRMIRPTSKIQSKENYISWDINSGLVSKDALEGYDVVIHLAGANLADSRWTDAYKKVIYDSRVKGTLRISQILSELKNPPKLLLSASAVGYYGAYETHEEITEASPVGKDFLAKVCYDWERATQMAQQKGIRVVNMRFGAVLSSKGGALAKMLPIFQSGMGGKLGNGTQGFSWIALDEIPLIMDHLINTPTINGPVNVVGFQAVTNEQFTKILGEVLSKPTNIPAPAFAIKTMFGEMGEVLLLKGARVVPKKLKTSGYRFRYLTLESSLRKCLE